MNTEATKHRLTLSDRNRLELCGVKEVVSFDEETVVLDTVCGMRSVEGSSLHIQVLNTEAGIVTLDGKVDAVSYYETESSEKNGNSGFFGKLFR